MFETETEILLIKKELTETTNFYYTKCFFLSKINLKKSNFDYYLNLANCYANHKINGCIYSDQIMNSLNSVEELC